jgi:high-affinity iron transporter
MWILAVVVPVTFVAACASPQAATRSPSSSAVGSSSPVAPAATAADQALQPVLACGSTNLDKNAAAASSPVAGGSGGVPKPEGSGASEPLAPEPSVAPSGPVQVGAYADLVAANRAYVSYAASTLRILSADVATLQADLARSDLASARRDWLAAELDWERVGASYDSFGDLGLAVDGLPDGLPAGVNDPRFTGLHRLEYGLCHSQDAATLLPIANRLATDVASVSAHLDDRALAGDPTILPLRAHEILEDALRDHLSDIDDEGAGAAFAETSADVDATRTVLGELAPLMEAHDPSLVATATTQMNDLAAALQAAKQSGQWLAPAATPLAARQRIDAAMGQLLETLAPVPELLSEPAGG